MANLGDILEKKGSAVLTIEPDATVLDAVERMNEHRVGAVVVCDGGRVRGIFTERDLLRRVVGERRDPAATRLSEVMTTEVVCAQPFTGVDEARSIFMQQRIRHLPVVDRDGRLRGLASIGDLNAWQLDGQEAEIHYLHEYMFGRC
jgi:CBS domain-containing protein